MIPSLPIRFGTGYVCKKKAKLKLYFSVRKFNCKLKIKVNRDESLPAADHWMPYQMCHISYLIPDAICHGHELTRPHGMQNFYFEL